LCAGFARDRADALRAWCGPTLAERQTAERQKRRRLAEEATAKAQEKLRRLAEEATAKTQEKQRRLAEEATAKAQAEKQRGLAQEATAKAQAEKQPPAPPKAEPQRHQAAKAFTAPHTRPPVAPLPPARKPPFRGSKKH
jgi:colicin import membrane protein